LRKWQGKHHADAGGASGHGRPPPTADHSFRRRRFG
jgi:hypothetical protein